MSAWLDLDVIKARVTRWPTGSTKDTAIVLIQEVERLRAESPGYDQGYRAAMDYILRVMAEARKSAS